MKIYLLSLATGVLVGTIYALLDVRSPAPPTIALIGLLGILLGEQLVPFTRQVAAGQALSGAWHSMEWMPPVGRVSQGHPPEESPHPSDADPSGRT